MVDGRRACGGLKVERSKLNSQLPSSRGVWKDAPMKWNLLSRRSIAGAHGTPPAASWTLDVGRCANNA